MKKFILTTALCLTSAFAWSQNTVTDRWGNKVPAPVFDEEGTVGMRLGKHDLMPIEKSTHKVLGKPSPNYVPHKGSPRILTILVNFADSAITVKQPKKAFQQFFNQEGTLDDLGNGNYRNHGSVSQYFHDMSGGLFRPKFDIYGPVTLPKAMEYYGKSPESSSSGEKSIDLVNDALSLIVDSVADASVYDNDGDNLIDCVYIIYAGIGQNYGGGANTVWAKTGAANGTFKGLKLNWYSMASELSPIAVSNTDPTLMITGVGVTCHEFSHALGLPDIYPTTTSARVNNQEMEYWDLMDGGEYVSNGYRPTAYTAWEKTQMEWPVTTQTLKESATGIQMDKTTEQGGVVYKIQNDEEPLEYFLLENIQKQGWNRSLPGHGLLVYHVNEVGNTNIYINTKLNNEAGKPGMAVVPADGECLSSYIKANSNKYLESHKGDPYPGTSNVTALNDNMNIPNFYWYAGTNPKSATNNTFHKVDKALANIAEENGVITFDFISSYATGIREVSTNHATTDGIVYSINGQRLGTSVKTLQPGIYVRNGKKFVVK